MNRLLLAILACGAALSMGCNRNPTTYPIKGRVHFPSGSPVRMGTIETKSRELGINARGTINSDGSFELTTFQPGDGAVAGWHDCVVVQLIIHGEEFKGKVSSFGVVDPKHASYAARDYPSKFRRIRQIKCRWKSARYEEKKFPKSCIRIELALFYPFRLIS